MSSLLPLELLVTLRAELAGGRERDEVLVLGAMRPVAAQARKCKVLVARVPNLVADRVCRVLLPVMTRAALVDDRVLLHQI